MRRCFNSVDDDDGRQTTTDDDGRTTEAYLSYKLTNEPSGSGELKSIWDRSFKPGQVIVDDE